MTFGDIATVSQKLRRNKGYRRNEWVPVSLTQPRTVMIIGTRTLNNGIPQWFDDHVEYSVTGYVHAYMVVAVGGRTNPFYVTPDMLEAKQQNGA